MTASCLHLHVHVKEEVDGLPRRFIALPKVVLLV